MKSDWPQQGNRTARIDIRLTVADRDMLERVAKKSRRTVTSLFQEWIDILKKDET